MSDAPASPALFADVVGQAAAVAQLRACAVRPVHAYLVIGPPGLGQRALVRGFAAAVLCPRGGCAACDVCRRAVSGVHPDLVEFERVGAALSVDDARSVVRLAQRRPLEAARQVLVVPDLHVARLAAPVLLKTLEEPAGDTVFVLLADSVPADLATVASRCVRVDLAPLGPEELARWLQSEGLAPAAAAELADAAAGIPERARLLASDTGLAARRALWRSVPSRLDGTGSSAATLAAELLAAAEEAAGALRARHE
ncbi:MAG: DNA polymerase III subunit delta', partial [Acidimicrobiales bacterium]